MTSTAVIDDESEPPKPKADTPNVRPAPTAITPRNGATPTRKMGGAGTKARTPRSAPANARRIKKAEPTLLSDFLLGRPSPQRIAAGAARRRSLDAVKKEMKLGAETIGKVPPPGGVKDRVKQWQMASAAELAASKAEEYTDSNTRDDGDDELNIRAGDSNPRTGRRKSREAEDEIPSGGTAKDLTKRSKSAGAPKKRVISDDHWMQRSEKKKFEKKKSPPRKGHSIPKHFTTMTNNPPLERKIREWAKKTAAEEPEPFPSPDIPKGRKIIDATPRKGAPIPANFLTTTNNPPLAKKIDDWIKKSANEQFEDNRERTSRPETRDDTPSRRTTSRQGSSRDAVDENDTRRRKKAPRQEQASNTSKPTNSSRLNTPHDGIQARPSPDPIDDETEPSQRGSASPIDDGVRVQSETGKISSQRKRPIAQRTPRARNNKERKPSGSHSLDSSSSFSSGSRSSDYDHEDSISWTPSRKQSRRRPRNSDTMTESLAEIPLGNSAFSVLDLPIGAEANTLRRRPPPKRTASFSMPNVFKKVYNEARNMVHDTVEPQRPGISNPPNIESWLNATSDPFVDAPVSELKMSESSHRRHSLEDDQQTEPKDHSGLQKNQQVRGPQDRDMGGLRSTERVSPNDRDKLPSTGHSPAVAPIGLKRSPATRNAPLPKIAKKTFLKDAFLEAFRGESTTTTPRGKSSPQEEISGFRRSHSPQEVKSAESDVVKKTLPRQSPPAPKEDVNLNSRREAKQPPPLFSKRSAPTTGDYRLSTIASVQTFSTGSSLSGTATELSKTTITQDTASSLPTESNLSRSTNKTGLKRRLTKHSDLLSVLSLPDPAEPDGLKTIRPARSLRTSRVRLETATIRGLLKELAGDEAKYMRELNTLVDGVIPVLLSSVLSKSESAIAAGLFDPSPDAPRDASFTKPIVDMGVALERLRSLHKRIPLGDPEALVSWAHGAHKTYNAYVAAWRMGFQDVVVNLAPASPSSPEDSNLDAMSRNAHGDVIDGQGERVDVAFLLKRPVIRVKYLSKIFKGFNKLKPTDLSAMVNGMWEDLEVKVKLRVKEENAMMVDRAAYNTDPTRARDPSTLALADDTKIDRTRQVCAKDYFFIDMPHSNGQRIECQVELLLRDKPSDKGDEGDILICAVNDVSRWLLFTPIPKKYTSARLGDAPGQVVVLVRGAGGSRKNWQETFLLQTDDHEAADEWVEMLGTMPIPPRLLSVWPLKRGVQTSSPVTTRNVEIPIGERRRREAEESMTEQPYLQRKQYSTTYVSIDEDSMDIGPQSRDLNDAMRKAGQLPSNNQSRARDNTFVYDRYPTATRPQSSDSDQTYDSQGSSSSSSEAYMSGALIYVPKDAESTKVHDNSPPAPPAHRTPITPDALKNAGIVIDSPTPRAKTRRTSSPLKHEYQPFDASPVSGESDLSGDSSSGTDEELEEEELPEGQLPTILPQEKRATHLTSSRDSGYISAPPNSAQALSLGPSSPRSSYATKFTASISCWNVKKGCWKDLHPEQCSIVISPGLIEAFVMSASHSSPAPNATSCDSSPSGDKQDKSTKADSPLIAIEITPFINLRQSNGLDIEIHATPKPNSLLQCHGAIRYRSPSPVDCNRLYSAIHKSRLENPALLALEQEAAINAYGTVDYPKPKGLRSIFRRPSYRSGGREAPPAVDPSEQPSHSSSTFSRLRHKGFGSRFNIGKSSVGLRSATGSAYGSGYSGRTNSGSIASAFSSIFSSPPVELGSVNIKVRLYYLATPSKWDDRGEAFVTFSQPPPGMVQASSLDNGIENRVTVMLGNSKDEDSRFTIIDEVLGANCYSKLGRTGITVTIWQDVKDDRGAVGRIGRRGGASGRTRKWCFQTTSAREAAWILGLTQRSALTY